MSWTAMVVCGTCGESGPWTIIDGQWHCACGKGMNLFEIKKMQKREDKRVSLAAEIVRKGLEAQAEVENYGEGTVTITGPVDLHELATYIDRAMRKERADG